MYIQIHAQEIYLRRSDSKVCNVIEDRYVSKVWNLMKYIVLCAQKKWAMWVEWAKACRFTNFPPVLLG